jgi:hypothetical protein
LAADGDGRFGLVDTDFGNVRDYHYFNFDRHGNGFKLDMRRV